MPKSRPAGTVQRASLIALMMLVASAAGAPGQEESPGITEPIVLPPFDASAASCDVPDLKPILSFAQDNERDFMDGVRYGLELAAKDRGLIFGVALANDDADLQASQLQEMRENGVGALVAAPVDPVSLAAKLKQMIWSGAYVGTVVPPPATTILNAPQYLTGKELGDAAAAYIRDELGGTANIVLLTHDSIEVLTPRFTAMRDSLRTLPGANIVADISPASVSEEGGYQTMKTILVAHPDIDVVLGADTVVLGALKALREAGKDRPEQFLGGIDGEPEAVAEIRAGGGPYKISVSLASPVFGYALGQFAADWLEGKSVPQAMDVLPMALSADNLDQYEADLADPGAVFEDPARRDRYLRMYGNICFDTNDQYLNFPWSSEGQ